MYRVAPNAFADHPSTTVTQIDVVPANHVVVTIGESTIVMFCATLRGNILNSNLLRFNKTRKKSCLATPEKGTKTTVSTRVRHMIMVAVVGAPRLVGPFSPVFTRCFAIRSVCLPAPSPASFESDRR